MRQQLALLPATYAQHKAWIGEAASRAPSSAHMSRSDNRTAMRARMTGRRSAMAPNARRLGSDESAVGAPEVQELDAEADASLMLHLEDRPALAGLILAGSAAFARFAVQPLVRPA